MMKFPHLFSPITIRGVTYKNRIIAGPITSSGELLSNTEKQDQLESIAAGGAAEVIVGETRVNSSDAARSSRVNSPLNREGYDGVFVDYSSRDDKQFSQYREIAGKIRHYGAVAMIELFHPGDRKTPAPGEPNPWGPMSYLREDGVQVEAFDREKMDKVCRDFAAAALYMKDAGFNGVVSHSGHGWLFTQFLSRRTNRRTDEYGGSMENRARFPLEILKAIRNAAGEDFIIEARINGEEMMEGGITINETVEFCRILEREHAVDLIHISMGQYYKPARTHEWLSSYAPHGANIVYAEAVKKAVKTIPVAVVGGFNSPEQGEEFISQGRTDFIVLSRQMIADPEFANKAARGDEKRIRRCLRCFACYSGKVEHESELAEVRDLGIIGTRKPFGTCSINPTIAHPAGMFPPPSGKRRVLIVGGGISGLQSAVTACERGHTVTLVERSNHLGGILQYTDYDDYKADFKAFRDLLISEASDAGANILLNTEVTPEWIRDFEPDVLIIAVGAESNVPKIPGIERAIPVLNIYTPDGDRQLGERVAIMGSGMSGCEAAIHLARLGKKVTVIEQKHRIAPQTHFMALTCLLDEMAKYDSITELANTCCLEIRSDGVLTQSVSDGSKMLVQADSVISCFGMHSNSQRVNALMDAAGTGVQVFAVGDAKCPGQVYDCIDQAYVAAMSIQ